MDLHPHRRKIDRAMKRVAIGLELLTVACMLGASLVGLLVLSGPTGVLVLIGVVYLLAGTISAIACTPAGAPRRWMIGAAISVVAGPAAALVCVLAAWRVTLLPEVWVAVGTQLLWWPFVGCMLGLAHSLETSRSRHVPYSLYVSIPAATMIGPAMVVGVRTGAIAMALAFAAGMGYLLALAFVFNRLVQVVDDIRTALLNQTTAFARAVSPLD
ncbi:MAG: hypothetical protein AB7K09_09030 [Planctomycetota bacterium]